MIATKTRRHFAAAFATAAVAAALMLCLPNNAWAAEESEPNDSFATADSLELGSTMYGTTRSKVAFGSIPADEDYFSVNVPVSGNYKLTVANEEYQKGAPYFMFETYNLYYERIAYIGVMTNTTKPESKTIYLQKGMNFVKVSGGAAEIDTPYRLKLTPAINKTSISKVTAGKKTATVKFKKKVGSSKYQVRYATKSSMKGAKTVTVKKSASSVKIKKLKANKKYYFQVRVVKTLDGKDFYSGWSAKKTVKVKR